MADRVLIFWVDGQDTPVAYVGGPAEPAELVDDLGRIARVKLLEYLSKRARQDRQPVPPYTEWRVFHAAGEDPASATAEPTGEVYRP